MIPLGSKQLHPFLGDIVFDVNRSVQELKVGFSTHCVTGGVPMPVTPLELVDGVGVGVEPVHSEAGVRNFVRAPIFYVWDVVMCGWMVVFRLRASHQDTSIRVFLAKDVPVLGSQLMIAPI